MPESLLFSSLLLLALVLLVAVVGLFIVMGVLGAWRRQQRRARQDRPGHSSYVDAWRMAGARYYDPAEDSQHPENPFQASGEAEDLPLPEDPDDQPEEPEEPDASAGGDTVDRDADEGPPPPGNHDEEESDDDDPTSPDAPR